MKKIVRICGMFSLFFLPVLVLSFLAYTVFHQFILLAGALLSAWAAFYVNHLAIEQERLSREVFSQAYELKKAGEALESCLATAAQTRAYNERLLDSKLTEECSRAKRYHRPLSCLMVAIDSLQELLQYHNLAFSETIIQEAARFLKESLRSVDSVIRYNEERLVVILPETNLDQSHIVANRIHFVVEKTTFQIEGKEIKLTASVAFVGFDSAVHRGKEDILAALEKTLLEARKAGPNQIAGVPSTATENL